MASGGQASARQGRPSGGPGGNGGGARTSAPSRGPGRGPGGPGHGPGGRFGPVEKAKDAKGTLMRLWGYVWRQRKSLSVVVVLITNNTGLGVLGPWL